MKGGINMSWSDINAKATKKVLGISAIIAVIVANLSLAGCTSSESATSDVGNFDNEYSEVYDADNGYYGSGSVDSVSPGVSESLTVSGSGTTGSTVEIPAADDETIYPQKDDTINPEKLVYTANVTIETKEFDEAVRLINEELESLGGIIQDENFYDDTPWEYYYGQYDDSTYQKISGYKRLVTTVRIPTSNFDKFLDNVGGIGHVTSSSSYVSNITQEYYSTKSYLESYQSQLDVLMSMYEQAQTIQDMITVEQRISEVQAEINRLTTRISSLDRDVAYSTVTITLSEVAEYSDTPREQVEKSFGQKVAERIVNSWKTMVKVLENLLYFVIDIMWLLIFVGIILVLVITINRVHRRKLIAKGVIDEYGRPIYKKPEDTKQNVDKPAENSEDAKKQ